MISLHRPYDVHLYATPESQHRWHVPERAAQTYLAQTVNSFSQGMSALRRPTRFAPRFLEPSGEQGPLTMPLDEQRAERFTQFCFDHYVTPGGDFDCYSAIAYILGATDTVQFSPRRRTVIRDPKPTSQFEAGEGYVLLDADGNAPHYGLGAHNPDYLVGPMGHNGRMMLARGEEFLRAFGAMTVHRILDIQIDI